MCIAVCIDVYLEMYVHCEYQGMLVQCGQQELRVD
jgi:hypothetical protein